MKHQEMAIYNFKSDMNSFYEKFNEIKCNELTLKKIIEIIKTSKELNTFFNNQNIDLWKIEKYIKIMNNIKTNPKKFNVTNSSEKLLLLMFAVDPEFEAAIIYGECNTTKEIKTKFKNKFGLYDPNLIKIENYFIKHFLSTKQKENIQKEIEKRAFK